MRKNNNLRPWPLFNCYKMYYNYYMNDDIKEMVYIYNTFNIDWMGDKINSLSDLTRHHIVKKQYNGLNDKNNYALLTSSSHHLIHFLEINYNKEYNLINEMFLELNKSNKPPTEEYYENILPIIKRVKKKIKDNKRKK